MIGFQISYAIPLLLRAWQGSAFVRSDFHLGALGVPAAWISGAWLVCTSAILCWPSSFPVKAVSMNYTVVVVGATALGSGLFWLCSARYHFKGPKRVDAQVFKAREAMGGGGLGGAAHPHGCLLIPSFPFPVGHHREFQ